MNTPSRIAPLQEPLIITAADAAIMDHIVHIDECPEHVRALIEEMGCMPHEESFKVPITREDCQRMDEALRPHITASYPGGSSANLMVMAKSIMKEQADMTFIGAVGHDADGMAIREGLKKAGVRLVPELPEHLQVEGAKSFVIVNKAGRRVTATFAGNAQEVLNTYYRAHPGELEDLIKRSGYLKQGTQPLKIGRELTDRIIELQEKHDRPFYYTLPTNAAYAHDHLDEITRNAQKAIIVFGNDSELHNAFPLPEGWPPHVNGAKNGVVHEYDAKHRYAFQQLQACFAEHIRQNEVAGKINKKPPVAFITRGALGCFIITADVILALKGHEVKVKNELGAGDGSAGIFLAMLSHGASHKHAGLAAMRMGGELVQLEGPRLSQDPFAHMRTKRHSLDEARQRGSSVAKVIHEKLHGESASSLTPREPSASR
jgi:sugar/nucleoside kinase (ribokinase family)